MAVMRALVRRSSVVRLARETTLRYLTTGSSASEDYAYHLPERLVAQQPVTWSDSAAGPAASRDASRLLCVDIGGREESNSVEAPASLRHSIWSPVIAPAQRLEPRRSSGKHL